METPQGLLFPCPIHEVPQPFTSLSPNAAPPLCQSSWWPSHLLHEGEQSLLVVLPLSGQLTLMRELITAQVDGELQAVGVQVAEVVNSWAGQTEPQSPLPMPNAPPQTLPGQLTPRAGFPLGPIDDAHATSVVLCLAPSPVGLSHGEVGRGEGDGQPAEDGVVWGLLGLRCLFFILSPGSCHGRSQKLLLAGCAGHIVGVGHKPLATIQVCPQHEGVLLHPGNDGADFCGYLGGGQGERSGPQPPSSAL